MTDLRPIRIQAIAIVAVQGFFLALPLMANAASCCLCTHPQIKNGKFCIKNATTCSTLNSSTNQELKGVTCTDDTSANACKKVPAGQCVADPYEELAFKLANVPGYASAAGTSAAPQPPPAIFTPNIDIPDLTMFAPYKDENEVIVPMLAQYIQALQKLLIGVGLVAAAIMVMYGGFLYIVSGTGAKVQEGKKVIIDALIGLIILLGAVVILSNLNPNTTTLGALHLININQQAFEFDTGYNPGESEGGMTDFNCSGDCPAMQKPEFKGAASRMKAVCGGNGSKDALKNVLLAWQKEAAPYGSGYIRGGSGYGKDMQLASPFSGYIFCGLGRYGWLTDETKTACGLPSDFKFDPSRPNGHCKNGETINVNNSDLKDNTLIKEAAQKNNKGQCYEALKKNYASHFVCPMKCNDLFGADCSGFVDMLLSCAGVKRNANDVYAIRNQAIAESKFAGAKTPAVPPLICKDKSGHNLSASDPKCAGGGSDDCKCEPYKDGFAMIALNPDDALSHKSSIPFGTTMEKNCKGGAIAHMFLYTGGTGLPFEVIQSGGGGGAGPTFLNWFGQSEFTVGMGVNTVSGLDAYLRSCNIDYIYAVAGFTGSL